MEMQLMRRRGDARCTIGQLYVNGVFQCWTLEDVVRDGPKVKGQTAIPAGRYLVVLDHSQRFGRVLPHVLAVPGFEGIRIHPGNTDADTEGCVLVGKEPAVDTVLQSRVAMAELQPKIQAAVDAGEEVWLSIKQLPKEGA